MREIATFSRLRLNRNSSRRGRSSPLDVAIEKKTTRFVHEWNAGGAGSRLVLEPDGSAVLRTTLPLYRGIGETHIVGLAGDFECEVRTLSAALRPG